MKETDILRIARLGEDSTHQFKRLLANEKQAAAEMCAFANGGGGQIFIGIEDDGTISGLTIEEVRRQNAVISTAAAQHVRNPLSPTTEVIEVDGKTVLVVTIDPGVDKPYFDSDGAIWQKMGADKRRLTSKEELRRLFQSSDLLHADQIPVRDCGITQLHAHVFERYYERRYGHPPDLERREILLENLYLAADGCLNLAGLLLFGQNPQRFKPGFVIRAVWFEGNSITGTAYRDSVDLDGRIADQFEAAMSFLKRNIPARQNGQSVNSQGQRSVPDMVWQELVGNALLHRNYFLNAPIRLLGFDDRVEIISPGSLPNHLTVERIKAGNASLRNSVLTSYAVNGMIPYRGLGSGIMRVMEAHPDVEFLNDPEGQQFTVIVRF